MKKKKIHEKSFYIILMVVIITEMNRKGFVFVMKKKKIH